jgi:hypothetical protein
MFENKRVRRLLGPQTMEGVGVDEDNYIMVYMYCSPDARLGRDKRWAEPVDSNRVTN